MKYVSWDEQKLEELVRLWNMELGEKFPMRKDLFKQNSFDDENVFLPGSFIAMNEDNQVIGFIVSKVWQENINVQMNQQAGWIQVLLVHHEYRGQGIGTTLLTMAEAALKESAVSKILLGRDPWHYFPGVPHQFNDVKDWFEHQGYVNEGSEYDLICHYNGDLDIDLVQRADIDFSLLKIEDKEEFLSFLHRCFPGRWEYEAIHYFKKGGIGREYVVLKKNNRIIGFCRINDDQSPFVAQNVYWAPLFNESLGGVGPLGIDSNERKNGYGLAVVEAGVQFLRKRENKSIIIDWTGLVDFYGKLGFETWIEYSKYGKTLNKNQAD